MPLELRSLLLNTSSGCAVQAPQLLQMDLADPSHHQPLQSLEAAAAAAESCQTSQIFERKSLVRYQHDRRYCEPVFICTHDHLSTLLCYF